MERLYDHDQYDANGSINLSAEDQSPKVQSSAVCIEKTIAGTDFHLQKSEDSESDSSEEMGHQEQNGDVIDDLTKPLLVHVVVRQTKFQFFRKITVEPFMFFLLMASAMQSGVTKNVIIDKLCLLSLDVNNTGDVCDNISNNQTLEAALQIQAAKIDMYLAIVDTVPAIFVSTFLGAASDKYGRKLSMIFPVVGYIVSTAFFGVFSYFMTEIPPIYALLGGVPRALCGGLLAVVIMTLSYVSDITTAEDRTVRVAYVEGMILLSQPAGSLLSGWLYKYSFPLVYLVAGAFSTFSLLYLIFLIPETIISPTSNKTFSTVLKNVFDIQNLKETVITALKDREFHGRRHLLLLMLITSIGLIPFFGNTTILFYYTRLRLNWDLKIYSYFSAISTTSITLGLVFMAVVFVRRLKLPDLGLAVVGLLASITSSILMGFVISPLMIYLICIPAAFGGGTSLAVRSQVSKLVPRDEQGKVFSLLGTVETIIPLVASVLYTEVYNATVNSVSGTVFFMSAGILLIPLALVLYLIVDMLRIYRSK